MILPFSLLRKPSVPEITYRLEYVNLLIQFKLTVSAITLSFGRKIHEIYTDTIAFMASANAELLNHITMKMW